MANQHKAAYFVGLVLLALACALLYRHCREPPGTPHCSSDSADSGPAVGDSLRQRRIQFPSSSAQDVSALSGKPGAARVALLPSNSANFRWSLPGRFVAAVEFAVELARAGAREELVCPSAQHLGSRPSFHPPTFWGTLCESWIHRQILAVLGHLLDNSMVGLEWSSGSSTLWLLRRLKHVYSCEHSKEWLLEIEKVIVGQLPWRRNSWEYHHAACGDTTKVACPNYVDYPIQQYQPRAPGGFDFVSVDGVYRPDCMKAAIAHNLVKPQYGILMLDNADRPQYAGGIAAVPPHWLMVSFYNPSLSESETAIWMACPEGDAFCKEAQTQINDQLKLVPKQAGPLWRKRFA